MKNLEIERKFLVKKRNLPNLKKYKYVDITQGFIYLKPCVRVRKAGDKCFITIKTKPPKSLKVNDDLVRTELETEIPKSAYKYLLKLCKGHIIEKRRYFIPYKKRTIELDVFKGKFKDLIYAEVEFKDLKSAKKFVSPEWFYKEVTGIGKYKNTSLSVCKNIKKLIKY